MTPERREAAIERMAEAAYTVARRTSREWGDLGKDVRSDFRVEAAAALDALPPEFVVLHRDDVTEEDRFRQIIKGGWGQGVPTHERRLVTRWEPTTKEDNDGTT